MNKLWILVLLGFCLILCSCREPIKAPDGSLPFLVYFESRYRGICVGSLVSRMAVLTAAVCVVSPLTIAPDTRPINVITGAAYRHARRGIRVQVTQIVLPKLPNVTSTRGYFIQKSVAMLILKRKVPDILAEIPLRPLDIDYKGDEVLSLQDECIIPGWHFFYKGDKIYPVHRFLLQRNVRLQFVNIVKKHVYCETLSIKFHQAMDAIGYTGVFSKSDARCVKDPDRAAQPCHGMYGAPLICRQGRAVGMLMAPDAQWSNCTGFSNIVHVFNNEIIAKFMECVSSYFEPEFRVNWRLVKAASAGVPADDNADFLRDMYDRIISASSSESEALY